MTFSNQKRILVLRVMFIIAPLCILPNGVYAQDSINNKYLVSLIYLKSNKAINLEIKKTFPHAVKKREQYIEFNLREEIMFLPIYFFENQLIKKNFRIEKEFITTRSLYNKRYGFSSYQYPLFGKLLEKSDSKIVLTFSEPIEDYLVAEMLDARLNLGSAIKMGPAIQFLFKFNDAGLIEDVLIASCVYN